MAETGTAAARDINFSLTTEYNAEKSESAFSKLISRVDEVAASLQSKCKFRAEVSGPDVQAAGPAGTVETKSPRSAEDKAAEKEAAAAQRAAEKAIAAAEKVREKAEREAERKAAAEE